MDRTLFRECRALLFDFGGTIDSDGEHWLDRFFALYEDTGLDIPREDIKRAFYHADAACHADPGVPSLGFRPLVDLHVRFQFEALSLSDGGLETQLAHRFCSGAEEVLLKRAYLLEYMKTRFRLGIVSNFFGNLERVLEEARLTGSMETIIDSGRVGVSKPDLAIFRLALERLDLPPGQVAFVGDSYERDMIPSALVGMKTVWLKGPHPRMPEKAPPVDTVITRLSDLEVLIS
jgi:putative hydrolase of the HAD superfamily